MGTFDSKSWGYQGPGPHFPAGDGINEAQAALYAGHTLVLSSSLSAARLLSFTAGCRPVSGADAQPDNEQYISLAEGHREPEGEGESTRASGLTYYSFTLKQNKIIGLPGSLRTPGLS